MDVLPDRGTSMFIISTCKNMSLQNILLLLVGIFILVSSILGVIQNVKGGKNTKWWRWMMDGIGIPLGIEFIYGALTMEIFN